MPSKTKHTADVLEEPPTSIDPYETLEITSDATDDQIKKAYRKAALKHHPDKAIGEDAQNAKETFQKIAFAYAILSDPRRRKRYDTTGSTEESIGLEDDDFDWGDFFRAQYEDITTEKIAKFTETYKQSDEEREAVLAAYVKSKGNMDYVYEAVMVSNVLEDDERFRAIIDNAIASNDTEAYNKYTKESDASKARRIKNAQREAKEAEEEEVKATKKKASKGEKSSGKKTDSIDSLAALISQRQKARGSAFLDDLEEKYTKLEGAKSKKRGPIDEPSEEAFAATAARSKKTKGRK